MDNFCSDKETKAVTNTDLYFRQIEMLKEMLKKNAVCEQQYYYSASRLAEKVGMPPETYLLEYYSVEDHYDALINEDNDPVHDPPLLQEYMDKWDGAVFIKALHLTKEKSALEIGVGTGRLAIKTARLCGSFTGIDISSKTINRAKKNLSAFSNISLVCDDFMTHKFNRRFNVIYTSLSFMHISEKQKAIKKIADLLLPGGRFVLSFDKSKDEYIIYDNRKIRIYPDNSYDITEYCLEAGLKIVSQTETEFANIIAAKKVKY